MSIWALSPRLTGEQEPWDANATYLPASLALASLLIGFVFPKRFYICPIGLLVGQIAFMLIFLPTGPLIMIGFIFLVGYSTFISLPLSFLTSQIRMWIARSL